MQKVILKSFFDFPALITSWSQKENLGPDTQGLSLQRDFSRYKDLISSDIFDFLHGI